MKGNGVGLGTGVGVGSGVVSGVASGVASGVVAAGAAPSGVEVGDEVGVDSGFSSPGAGEGEQPALQNRQAARTPEMAARPIMPGGRSCEKSPISIPPQVWAMKAVATSAGTSIMR